MNNATALEWVWAIAWGITFVGTLIGLGIVAWKYHIYRLPHPITGKRQNGKSVWLYVRDVLLYSIVGIIAAPLCGLGILAMTLPEPIRPEGREGANIMAIVFIALAVLVASGVVANLVLGWIAFYRGGKE